MIDQASTNQLIAAGQLANALTVYQDTGNLYQFGNEPINDDTNSHTVSYGIFTPSRVVTQIRRATLVENGPARWRFVVVLTDATSNHDYEITYTLIAGEPWLRIAITGRAPDDQSSVVTVSQFGSGSTLPDGLTRGTAYHWDATEPVRYWWGPTFQATHDYLLPTISGQAIAAVYHGGTPAWCRDQGDSSGNGAGPILGVLFRSANGQQRGAAGTDPDVHTQHFAFGGPGAAGLDPTTCAPLQNGLTFSTPLHARRLPDAIASGATTRTLPDTLSLASVSGAGLIRAARVQTGSGGTPTNTSPVITSGPPTSLVLRLYTPTNAPQTPLTVTLPSLPTGPTSGAPFEASLVTALEQPIPTDGLAQPASSITGTTNVQVSINAATALTTLQIVTQRAFVQPDNGKGS
jgi:alpha-mannosidase